MEEIYFANESTPLYIDKKSESLKLIQKLRDEAHRFSLRQYRNRRDNNFLNSELNSIDGIGEKTALSLMKKFKSVNSIKTKSIKELNSVVGQIKQELFITTSIIKMKYHLIILLFFLLHFANAQNKMAFKSGEWFKYKLSYSGWFKAGEATVNLTKSIVTINYFMQR